MTYVQDMQFWPDLMDADAYSDRKVFAKSGEDVRYEKHLLNKGHDWSCIHPVSDGPDLKEVLFHHPEARVMLV